MRLLFTLWFTITVIFPPSLMAQVAEVEGFYTQNISANTNYVLNKSCARSTKDIVASVPATLSRRSTGGLENGKDCAFDATALGQTIKWNLRQYDPGLKGGYCMASFTYQYAGAAGDYRAYIERNGIELPNTSASLQSTGTDAKEQFIYFPCGDLTSATKPVIVSTVANPGVIYTAVMDSGKSNQQTIVDAPEWVGSVTYSTGGVLNISNTTFNDTVIASTGPAYSGKLAAPSVANRVGFTITSGLPGRYVMTASAIYTQSGFGLSSTNTYGIMSFGYSELVTSALCGSMSSSANESGVHDALSQSDFSCAYTATTPLSSKEFWIKHLVNISTAQAVVRAGARIDVYRYPTINSSVQSAGIPEAAQYVGEIFPTATTSCPSNSLPTDGAAVSRIAYQELFSAIGTSHGQGDGSTTFNVPDYRGRFIRGVDSTANRDPDKASRTAMNPGGNTGNNVGSVQGHEFYSHTHNQNSHYHVGGVPFGMSWGTNIFGFTGPYGGIVPLTPPVVGAQDVKGHNTSSTTATNQNSGGNETRPVNAYVNFCIRARSTRLTANLLNTPKYNGVNREIKQCDFIFAGTLYRNNCITGTCTIYKKIGDCNPVVTRSSAGVYNITFDSGYWTSADSWYCSRSIVNWQSSNTIAFYDHADQTNTVSYITAKDSAGSGNDIALHLRCSGY